MLDHGDFAGFAFGIGEFGDYGTEIAFSGRVNLGEGPFTRPAERHHHIVPEDSFRHPPQIIAGAEFPAGFGHRREVPDRIIIKRGQINAAAQEKFARLRQFVQRVLQAVVDLGDQAGTEFDAQEFAGEFHPVIFLESGGAFENLHVGAVAAHPDDFAFQPLGAGDGVGDFILRHLIRKFDGQHIAVDADYPALFEILHENRLLICLYR
ncbi:hypothetical protein SDC9_157016 [bioreactor metagenome]|uniref:Uncharacterized protein n=1 Tax=bioreactor metagenome TaxID=1076179 RepID=A0A645FAZ3_9ZZZZ